MTARRPAGRTARVAAATNGALNRLVVDVRDRSPSIRQGGLVIVGPDGAASLPAGDDAVAGAVPRPMALSPSTP